MKNKEVEGWVKEFRDKFACDSGVHYVECCYFPNKEGAKIIEEWFRKTLSESRKELLEEVEDAFVWAQRINKKNELIGDMYIHVEWKEWKKFKLNKLK